MKFTDKFLEVPFMTYDGRAQEIMNTNLSDVELMTQRRKIDIEQIEAYEEVIPDNQEFNDINLSATNIFMKSGNEFIINMSLDEFEEKLNNFNKKGLTLQLN